VLRYDRLGGSKLSETSKQIPYCSETTQSLRKLDYRHPFSCSKLPRMTRNPRNNRVNRALKCHQLLGLQVISFSLLLLWHFLQSLWRLLCIAPTFRRVYLRLFHRQSWVWLGVGLGKIYFRSVVRNKCER